jgi:hypothetical protein
MTPFPQPAYTMMLIALDAEVAARELRAQGPRLHQVLAEHCSAAWSADELGGLRLAIADALRTRLGSSPALEDFVSAPEVR